MVHRFATAGGDQWNGQGRWSCCNALTQRMQPRILSAPLYRLLRVHPCQRADFEAVCAGMLRASLTITRLEVRTMATERLQLWSCGGGRQSAGIAALLMLGELPRPDCACMIKLEWEVETVWPYVFRYILPALTELSIPFHVIPRAKYATKDFFGGEEGVSPLLPMYTDQSGGTGKLSEWCSGEWKREVVIRWAAQQPGWKQRGVDNWVGISTNEEDRRRSPRRQWIVPVYPLLDVRRTSLGGCLLAVDKLGWALPPRSRCEHCPNQQDREWLELSPSALERAAKTEDYIRSIDPHAFLHKSMVPLRMVKFDADDDNGGLFGGCQSGACY